MKQCSYCVFSKMQLLKDKHTIWENENYLYFIQMSGKEIESKSFDFAAEATAKDGRWHSSNINYGSADVDNIMT